MVSICNAQSQYLATLDYQNLSVNRIGYPLGAGTPMDSFDCRTTYDENHRRIFFMKVLNLYTLDASSGTTISNVPSYMVLDSTSTGWDGTTSFGLEYDNATDTLYGMIVKNNDSIYLCWVEPATGKIHPRIGVFYNTNTYSRSAFDAKDHWYIYQTSTDLYVLNATSGAIVYHSTLFPAGNVFDLQFDSLTHRLYGICIPPGQNAQFDSIELSTGIEHQLSVIPSVSYVPEMGTFAIDEAAGKYIFVGADPPSSACINKSLYVLDISTGNVLSRTPYPYARNLNDLYDENVVAYTFDNKDNILYALNWHVDTVGLLTSRVQAIANPICAGLADTLTTTFTVTPGDHLGYPAFQWQINGNNVGNGDSVYIDNNPVNGDSVRCILTTPSVACALGITDTSFSLVLHVIPIPDPSVSITASANNVCADSLIVFTASADNEGAKPIYLWQVNNAAVGTNNPVYSSNSLVNGDIVRCIMTSSEQCAQPVSSGGITMAIRSLPDLTLSATDTVIKYGQGVQLQVASNMSISSYQWTPSGSLNDPSIPDPFATPSTNTLYQVTALGADECPATAAIHINVYRPLQMPNAFTPNGNGQNEVFRVPPSLQITIFNFSIYNRWGERIFLTTNSGEGWDGRVHNQLQPPGTYVWKLEYQDVWTGKPTLASGTFMLIR